MPKKLISVAALAYLAACSALHAQTAVNTVRVFSDPAGVTFRVDGQVYNSLVELPWVAGSSHTVSVFDLNVLTSNTQYVYRGWMTNLSDTGGVDEPITAGPGLLWVKLIFDKQYQLTVTIPECVTGGQPCTPPGRVEVNSQSFDHSAILYIAANSTVHVRAFPNTGFLFAGWSTLSGLPAIPTQSFDITFVLVGPAQLVPLFQVATAVQAAIDVDTVPPSLTVLMDGIRYLPPFTLQWGWGSTHTVGADPVQSVAGVAYAFDSWSDGGAINHDIHVPSPAKPISLVAHYVLAHSVVFRTSPAGLQVSIDNRESWPSYSFSWAPGTVHGISAPATQVDGQGRKYRFVSWSNGQPAAFNYTAGPAPGGQTITATYQLLGQATIESRPLNLSVQVDGVRCNTPCVLERDAGASVSVSAAATLNATDQSRLVFRGWSDSAGNTRVIALSGDAKTYTVTYTNQNRLAVSASPSEGAVFTADPASPDGFYDADALVSIAAAPALGFHIRSWSGDITGSAPVASVALNVPRSAVLALDRVPAIAPLGVRSAAVSAPPDSVAPGSLISVFGASLAPALEIGPANPLVQTLQSVSVRVDDTFLPLLFVSPGQINAQLPAGTAPGAHKLTVRWEGRPETSAPVSVARNAPGLFGSGPPDLTVGYFVRASGETISVDRPAQPGEVVSVLGTGFGPYTAAPPDGFLLDEAAGYRLADDVSVTVGDASPSALYAGRSGAGVGVDTVRFQLPAALPETTFVPVKIAVNGRNSNTVLLPISH
jgi:uncharacterized protein (TIGR03437 family)